MSQERADSKRYPAIDPIDSYSKYLEYAEVQKNLKKRLSESWLDNVTKAKDILLRGKEAMEQINILGDDGVPLEFHERYWKSELIDFVILQQDAFDKIDASTPMERQSYMLESVLNVTDTPFSFQNFEEVGVFFKEVINVYKQMNYLEFKSDKFNTLEADLQKFLETKKS